MAIIVHHPKRIPGKLVKTETRKGVEYYLVTWINFGFNSSIGTYFTGDEYLKKEEYRLEVSNSLTRFFSRLKLTWCEGYRTPNLLFRALT